MLSSDISGELENSYRTLEDKIQTLSKELSNLSSLRSAESTEKEQLADRLRSILTLLPAGVILLDEQGVVVEANPAASQILGSELVGERWLDIIEAAFAPKEDDGFEVSLRDGKRVSLSTQALTSSAGQIVVVNDLTETRALQERLGQHKRLSEMGEMVASLAHQIRTPLSTALIYGSHLKRNDICEAQRGQYTEKLVLKLHHIEKQVKDMLIFVREGENNKESMTITEILAQFDSLVGDQVLQQGAEIRFNKNYDTEVTLVCNTESLVGAMQNIVSNALDTHSTNIRIIVNVDVINNDLIAISIEDNGPGINPEIQQNVFKPFFTTRCNGTGLGLAVVDAVVKEHGGRVALESLLEIGTKVTMFLPIKKEC